MSLSAAHCIKGRVNTTSLHNTLQVKISLSVTDQVNFFAGQFPLIWAQK